MHKNKTFEYLEKKNLITGDQIQRNFQNAEFGRLQLKTEWRQGFLEVTTASKLCWNFFWLNSLDQPPWQPQNWPLAFLRSKNTLFLQFLRLWWPFRKMLCPQSPLNRFSKVICQNVHGILGNNISHVQLCASIFHFLILRVNYYILPIMYRYYTWAHWV